MVGVKSVVWDLVVEKWNFGFDEECIVWYNDGWVLSNVLFAWLINELVICLLSLSYVPLRWGSTNELLVCISLEWTILPSFKSLILLTKVDDGEQITVSFCSSLWFNTLIVGFVKGYWSNTNLMKPNS